MEDRRVRRIPLGVVTGLSALVLASSTGVAWWTWNSFSSRVTNPVAPSAVPSATSTTQPSPSAQTTTEKTVQVYWLKNVGNKIELVPSQVALDAPGEPSSQLKTAFNRLLEGPTEPGIATTIPEGTKLRNLTLEDDGIHVDLSQQFASGGGSTSMTGRVAQVLYTATSTQPNAQVWLSVEGKPLEVLGGEGLLLEQPLTRQSFEQDFAL